MRSSERTQMVAGLLFETRCVSRHPLPQTHLTYSHRDESYTKGMKGGQLAALACQDDVLFFLTCLPQTHTFLLRFFLTGIKLSVIYIWHKRWQFSVSFCLPLLRLMTNFVGRCCFTTFGTESHPRPLCWAYILISRYYVAFACIWLRKNSLVNPVAD